MEEMEDISPRMAADLETFPRDNEGKLTMVNDEAARIQALARAASCHQKMLGTKTKTRASKTKK